MAQLLALLAHIGSQGCTGAVLLFQVDEDWTQKNYLEVFCGDLCKQSKLVSLEVFGCSSSGQASPRSPLPDQPPSAYVIIFKDITSTTSKQLEMETRLQSSEKRVNDLTVDSIFKRCWDSLYKQVLTCATANLELMYGVCQTVNVALLRADADGPQSVTGEVQMLFERVALLPLRMARKRECYYTCQS